jgi:SAM-dependent methyltransferase
MLHPEAAVREMRRVLKPGGRALLSVPNGRHLDDVLTQLAQKAYYGKSDHVQSFSVGSFHALLERCGLVVLDTKANRGSLTLLLDERLPLAPVCSKVLFPIARLLYNGVRSFDVLATKERSG